jgi:hypothetical protein
MALTKDDVRDFIRFADERIDNGGADSLTELACQWDAKRGATEVTLPVEIDADTARWLANAFPDVQDEERLQRALDRRGGITTVEMLGKAVLAAARAGRL